MIMALGTAQRRAEPDRSEGVHAVDYLLVMILERIRAGFDVERSIPLKAGRNLLSERGSRQEVAGELLDREAVERHVLVERVDHPIAPRPEGALRVALVAFGVRIACRIQPWAGPAFAKTRARQELIDEPCIVGVRRIPQESIDLRDCGRKTGEVERHASQLDGRIGIGTTRQFFSGKLGVDERVDGVTGAATGLCRHLRQARRDIGPVRSGPPTVIWPHGAFGHPLLQHRNLARA